MCRVLPVLALLVLTPCADGSERIIRTAVELKDFKFSNPTNGCLYDLTGIITDTSPIPHFTQFRRVVVLDESGACCVRCPTDRCPPVGVTARLRGRIYPQPSEWTSTVTRSADVLGPAQVPPPVDATVDQLFDEALNYRLVRVSGTAVEILPDEIDPRDYYLVLKSGDRFLRISVNNSQIPVEDAEQFIDAEIRVTGIFRTDGYGFKLTSRSELHVSNPADIAILRPPPDDPFDLPPLENMRYYSPERIATIGKRAITFSGDRPLIQRLQINALQRGDLRRDVQEQADDRTPSPSRASCGRSRASGLAGRTTSGHVPSRPMAHRNSSKSIVNICTLISSLGMTMPSTFFLI